MPRVASFHLGRFPARRALSRMITLPAERWELAESDGCVLGKVVGTSRQGTTRISADIGRWGIFAVWEDTSALHAFLSSSPLMKRWSDQARSLAHFELTPVSSRGTWGGVDPFPGLGRPLVSETAAEHPIAVLTHATIRPSKALSFLRAVPAVDDALARQPGNVMALGIGKWPFVQQATFSMWGSHADVRNFAYRGDKHSAVIRRAHDERWFREELFCRFTARELKSGDAAGGQ